MNQGLGLGLFAAGLSAAPLLAAAVELTPNARLHVDHAWHEADTRSLDDALIIRRAQFGLDGKVNEAWSFEVTYDFAKVGAFKDVFLQYEGWKSAAIKLGQFKVPFGLEELTSSNNITFIERALPGDAFGLSRRAGIGFDRVGSRYTFSAMGFGDAIDGDEGRGAGLRYTFTPVRTGDALVHLGVAVITERPQGEVKFNARPESRPSDTRFVNTGGLDDIRRVDRLGLEVAWQAGPLTAQAEWMRADATRRSGPDASFDGWYVAGSWVLTGEVRRYRNGVFKAMPTGKPYGAWELALRYSEVELDDGQVRGGREDNFSLGLNWYAHERWRLMADYISVRSERRGIPDNPAIVLVRVQFTL